MPLERQPACKSTASAGARASAWRHMVCIGPAWSTLSVLARTACFQVPPLPVAHACDWKNKAIKVVRAECASGDQWSPCCRGCTAGPPDPPPPTRTTAALHTEITLQLQLVVGLLPPLNHDPPCTRTHPAAPRQAGWGSPAASAASARRPACSRASGQQQRAGVCGGGGGRGDSNKR